ncbi:MAG: carbon-nitrogen hydrolase family protein [candidate division KSB1 bacterium]|jgi:nitrilase|nr:carbon-nitrogen hydrolase family protein [candidate division KSB1 bacterium]
MVQKSYTRSNDMLHVAIAQIAPVWLNRNQTIEKVTGYIETAAHEDCRLVVFGEALIPGYPFWIEKTDGARFNSPIQKEIYAFYMNQAVQIEAGQLDPILECAASHQIRVVLGIVERPKDRGGHSLYCSLVTIDEKGNLLSVHRKLMPTYEERLAWAQGDGHGLKTHSLGLFTMGALNCWENWMPLPRAALYAQGEDLHIAAWPGSESLTTDITRFIARESRSYVISASGLMRKSDISEPVPYSERIRANAPDILANGGSCIAKPDGEWLVEPCINEEQMIVAHLDHCLVRKERQNFDAAGHYSRPDILKIELNNTRQSTLKLVNRDRI